MELRLLRHTAEVHDKCEGEPRHHERGCELCDAHQKHLDQAKEAREAYWSDASRASHPDVLYMSADMMKVHILPQLPVKEALFTPRLTCYNETFAPPGSSTGSGNKRDKQQHKRATCVVWHDGLAEKPGLADGLEEVAARGPQSAL